jgi:hypothetical protein
VRAALSGGRLSQIRSIIMIIPRVQTLSPAQLHPAAALIAYRCSEALHRALERAPLEQTLAHRDLAAAAWRIGGLGVLALTEADRAALSEALWVAERVLLSGDPDRRRRLLDTTLGPLVRALEARLGSRSAGATLLH